MSSNFKNFAQQGDAYIKKLSSELGHKDDPIQTFILLRAVMHAVRDRIGFTESLHFLSQLPIFLKGLYVENWVYDDDSTKIKRLEAFKTSVKDEQIRLGEKSFDWTDSTEVLIAKVLKSLGEHYLTEGQLEHISSQMPREIKNLFPN
ncbi:DUF2267 domain-containing protein [Belliella sp. DSM 111904]|uniref:DUF2267 domain-containing protein n=1 Tax=Belliella filtrata TaxID=2923435 RepID=A0ABS9V2E5_9BACT|nr:DUF2267 domain-containing protein [Belliella filtrata]MCH7410592.1 DUF2267 domain-containing protein [Belliella filtrata]